MVVVLRIGIALDQEIAGEKHEWKNEIDRGAGDGDQRALPAGLGHEFVGSAGGELFAGIDFGDVLSGHADVAAERDGADSPVGGTPLEAEEAGAEADGEDVDANAEVAGDDEMSPLVNEDENTEDQEEAECDIHAGINPFRDSI